jgi:hypothetical protein
MGPRSAKRQTYAQYVKTSPGFELLQSEVEIDWVTVEQVASPRRAVRIELLRLDYPERQRAVTLPLGPGLAIPMVSVVGPAYYQASVSVEEGKRGPMTQFMFDDPIGNKSLSSAGPIQGGGDGRRGGEM